MPSWKGDPTNPVPFSVQEPSNRSEKIINDNRSTQVRRDTDKQRDFTISLEDIDTTILRHLQNMQIQVEDDGQKIKVPIFFGSPEMWTSAQRDGYMRDQQGKIILPVIVLKRTESANDETLQFFNRYLETSAMKLYSTKNKYTRFNVLEGKNVPINEVYNVVVPSHMLLTYEFTIWTELVEQQNKIVQNIQFNTKDYWGSEKGFRFRTRVESFGHSIELQDGDDRAVKTTFQLTTHGYILPDAMTKLERHLLTTQKVLTPKKIIISPEVVSTDYDLNKLDKNKEKWRNWKYPNLPKDTFIPEPSKNLEDFVRIYSQINNVLSTYPSASYHLPAPISSTSYGEEGWLSYDANYYYIYIEGQWKRVPIVTFDAGTTF